MISVSERGLTSTQWSVYNEATKRTQYSTVPTSSITAEAVTVGGCVLSQENAEEITGYQANALNQYAMLSVDDIADFIPSYDAAGNQTRVKTSTGIWAISYDAENRPTDFTSQAVDGTITTVHCEYDYMGRRTTKMVTVGNNVTLQQRHIYRGYLQIACIDLTRSHHPALWFITWDPTQPVATRPLAIQKDGTWYTYGWDLTKNICELYGPSGYIRTAYTYSPYGQVSSTGDVEQTIQWSSEYNDTELGLVYYNYRHYNPMDGCWTTRDYIEERGGKNLYKIGSPIITMDILGAWAAGIKGQLGHISKRGHSDFEGNEPNGPFNYNLEDTDAETDPFNPKATWRHFRPLQESEKDLTLATKHCNKLDFERYAHQMQDFFAHYGQGFRANKFNYVNAYNHENLRPGFNSDLASCICYQKCRRATIHKSCEFFHMYKGCANRGNYNDL